MNRGPVNKDIIGSCVQVISDSSLILEYHNMRVHCWNTVHLILFLEYDYQFFNCWNIIIANQQLSKILSDLQSFIWNQQPKELYILCNKNRHILRSDNRLLVVNLLPWIMKFRMVAYIIYPMYNILFGDWFNNFILNPNEILKSNCNIHFQGFGRLDIYVHSCKLLIC